MLVLAGRPAFARPCEVVNREYIPYELATYFSSSVLYGSSNFDSFVMGTKWLYSRCFVGVCASGTCLILLAAFFVVSVKLFLHSFS